MTRKSPSAPRQVELTRLLSQKINQSPFLFVSDDELTTGAIVPDGDWLNRVHTFLDDHESGISSDEIEREWALAMITRRYKRHLNPKLVGQLTKCLKPVKEYQSGDRATRLAKVKRDIKKVE